jgi:hypothetical protein
MGPIVVNLQPARTKDPPAGTLFVCVRDPNFFSSPPPFQAMYSFLVRNLVNRDDWYLLAWTSSPKLRPPTSLSYVSFLIQNNYFFVTDPTPRLTETRVCMATRMCSRYIRLVRLYLSSEEFGPLATWPEMFGTNRVIRLGKLSPMYCVIVNVIREFL